jgi:lipooligosaccharide transport system ATP-binding protein
MPGVDLPPVDHELLGWERCGLELPNDLRGKLPVHEADLVALRIMGHLAKWVPLDDPRQLRTCSGHHRDFEPELLCDQLLAGARDLFGGLLAGEHDVAALNVGLHVRESCIRQDVAKPGHRDAIARADVDASEENDVLRHAAQVTTTGILTGMDRQLAIRLRGVVKRYGPITAVNGLDLDVPQGTCVGLLGPNGAGKSTTMRLLTAQAIADEGELEVLGFRLPEESKQARARCGVSPQLDNLDVTLTVEQNLRVFAHLYRIGRAERHGAIQRALEIANLGDRRDTRVDKLSGGMRRRLLIARALVHRPQLLLLDEPTVGLDPQVRQELWALIDALRGEGTTILMSTHYIEEAQRLADTVLIMSHGRAVASGPPSDLVAEYAGREAIEVYGPPAALAEAEADAQAAGFRTRRTGTSISVLGIESADGRAPEGERRPANLEDVFVLLTGEEIS